MSRSAYLTISASVFALVAAAHMIRALAQWPIAIDSWSIPVALSWIAATIAGVLSAWGLTSSRERT